MDRLLFALCLGMSVAAVAAAVMHAHDRATLGAVLGIVVAVGWLCLADWAGDDDGGPSTPPL